MPSDSIHRRDGSRRFGFQFPHQFLSAAVSSAIVDVTGHVRRSGWLPEQPSPPPLQHRSAPPASSSNFRMQAMVALPSLATDLLHAESLEARASSPHSTEVSVQMPGEEGGGVAHVETLSAPPQIRPLFDPSSTSQLAESSGTATRDVEGREETSSSGSPSHLDSSTSPRYDLQQAAQWTEQLLPFVLLLLMVFVREHLQGFVVFIWITALLVRVNDTIRRQAALKNERRLSMLVAVMVVLAAHMGGIYWWYKQYSLWRPLALIPLVQIPTFWQALFFILVNDTAVRFGAMIVKCGFLVASKSYRGRPLRRRAQVLTLVEYTAVLYRALVPAPVWYRFFLNESYGHLFSSLVTGLYLTFKLTATFDKAVKFVQAVRAVARKEHQYGTLASAEEVLAVGDMCAICQEKMHAPISLRCQHVFCEDCVAEWFERERTCPLCRAIVKAAGLRSFGDCSTTLLPQIF